MNRSIKRALLKPASLVMAVAMGLTAVPVSALTAVRAEAAAARPVIYFVISDEDREQGQTEGKAEVITGESVFIKEPQIDGLSSNMIVLRNKDGTQSIESIPEGTGNETTSDAVTISAPVNGVREIHFNKDFNIRTGKSGKAPKDDANGNPIPEEDIVQPWYETGSATYNIIAVYQNINAVGEGYKRLGSGATMVERMIETITSDNKLSIMQESRLTIKAITGESGGSIQFKVLDSGQAPSGIFKEVTSASLSSSTAPASNNLSEAADGSRNLAIAIREGLNGHGEANTILRFNVTGTTKNKPGEGDPEQYNNLIQKDTIFEIVFSPIVSDPITLEVIPPQQAILDLESRINNSNGEPGKADYIRLAQGDSLQFVTKNFEVRQQSNIHSSKFEIEWIWLERDENGNVETDTSKEIDPTTGKVKTDSSGGGNSGGGSTSGSGSTSGGTTPGGTTPGGTTPGGTTRAAAISGNNASASSAAGGSSANSSSETDQEATLGGFFSRILSNIQNFFTGIFEEPAPTTDEKGISTIADTNDSDSIRPVVIGNSENTIWQPVGITRAKQNQYGTLRAIVSYINTNNEKILTATPREKRPSKTNVVIRGTGDPVDVSLYKYREGDPQKNEEDITLTDYKGKYKEKNPQNSKESDDDYTKRVAAGISLRNSGNKSIKMDAYKGGLGAYANDYPKKPEAPFEYILDINLGQDNGTAISAVINAAGDTDAVNFQISEYTSANDFKDYIPGTPYTNPNYINSKSIANHLYLKITAKEREDKNQKRINLSFEFYLPDSAGNPQLVSESEDFSTSLIISDNTPSRDSRLKSLLILDADAKNKVRIPFNFDPDTYTYTNDSQVVHIPYSTKGITITPTLNYLGARNNPISFVIQTVSGAVVTDKYGDRKGLYTPGKDDQVKDSGGVPVGGRYYLYHGKESGEIKFYDNDNDPLGDDYTDTLFDIIITVPSEDPRQDYWSTYTVRVVRDAPSEDDTLANLEVYLESDEAMANNLVTDYEPTKKVYNIWIPYSTHMLQVRYGANHERAKTGDMEVLAGDTDGTVMRENDPAQTPYTLQGLNSDADPKVWLKDVKTHFDNLKSYTTGDPDGLMTMKFTVTSEKWVEKMKLPGFDPGKTPPELGEYYVRINRLPPSKDPNVSSLIITDNDENPREYTPAFSPDTEYYTMEIPFSVRELKFNLSTNDANVSKVEIWQGNITTKKVSNQLVVSSSESNYPLARYVNGRNLTQQELDDGIAELRLGALTKAFKVNDITSEYAKNHDGIHPFHIIVWAEDANMDAQYHVRVRRAEPSNDAALLDLKLKNQLNQEINTFLFHPDQYGHGDDSYLVSVPFSTKQISFTPTTSHEYATVEIRDNNFNLLPWWGDFVGKLFPYLVESGATSKLFNLSNDTGPENYKEFHIIVRAEDYSITDKGGGAGEAKGTERIYCIKVYREPPSDDARLKSLVTQNTSSFKPIFISRRTDYTADVAEGAPGVIIIPTANHPGATIRVDGVVVQSGTPTDLIELLEIRQTVRIEVIAEDGVTRMVYKITFTNWNLVEKTSNADLSRLTVNYGLMTPNFQSAVLNYEVTAKENAWSVDIIPKLADPLATMRVLNGTLELGDYNGNYAMAIADGQSTVNIEVTSPDKTVTKTYTVDIFRNEEDKLKNWTPLEAEDINFEQVSNPIIVKIEEYPRVGASVFNAIREEHPEMSIIFQGNDYSIRFDGANLTRVIPQTEIYDFRMTLTSPDEDAIYDIIASRSANNDIISDVVMLYFDYHGSLPGPATFSLSLGHRYGNDLLYWHYYNKERDRIDYYGALESNSQGNIAVSIDHFSTYLVSPEHRIAGSEDKDGVVDELGMVSNGQDLLGSGGKLNPNTGAGAAARPMATNESRVFPSFVSRPDVYIRKKEDP